MRRSLPSWILLACLCAYAFIHSVSYALTNPVFESPDEPGHLAYINRFAAGKGLPNQYDPAQMMAEGHQNPLYYAALGSTLRLFGGPIAVAAVPNPNPANAPQFLHKQSPFPTSRDRTVFYLLRLIGCAMVALTVLQVGLASRAILPEGHAWLIAPLLASTLPQLAFIGGSISNDGLVCLLSACALVAAARCVQDPLSRRAWGKLGFWTGLAVLAKKNAICLIPAAALMLAVSLCQSSSDRRRRMVSALWGAVVAAVLIAPVLLRNQILYHDLLGNRMEAETLEALVYPQSLNSRHFRVLFPDIVPRSFVAHFGWMIVEVAPKYVWIFVRALLAGTLLSALAFLDPRRRPVVAYAWAALLLNVVGLVYYNLLFPQAQGRLLFPSLASIVVLCAVGASEFSRFISWPQKKWCLVPLAAGLLWFDWFSLLTNRAFYSVAR